MIATFSSVRQLSKASFCFGHTGLLSAWYNYVYKYRPPISISITYLNLKTLRHDRDEIKNT